MGVVALRDIRMAVEKVQNGQLTFSTHNMHLDHEEPVKQSIMRKIKSIAENRIKSQEEEDDDDARNDQLNPQLEVVDTIDSEWLKKRSISQEALEKENGKAKLQKTFSAGSDPCLAGAPIEVIHKKGELLIDKGSVWACIWPSHVYSPIIT